ncbi:MAG: hypothetical protein WD360_03320 [Nitriliruptoraceae bacterium]
MRSRQVSVAGIFEFLVDRTPVDGIALSKMGGRKDATWTLTAFFG